MTGKRSATAGIADSAVTGGICFEKEQIMDFTRRISQSNRGGLVIVIYDIFFAYMEDTKEAHDNGEWENYKTALRNASKLSVN